MTRIFCFFPFFSVSARHTSKRNMGAYAILLENVVFWSPLSVYVDSWIRMHYFLVKNSSESFLTASRYPTGNCLPMDRIAASKIFPKGLQWRGHDKREIKASSKSFYDRTPRFRGEGFFSLASSLLLAATGFVSNILFSSLVHRIFSTLDKRCSVRSFFGWLATFVQIHIYTYT